MRELILKKLIQVSSLLSPPIPNTSDVKEVDRA